MSICKQVSFGCDGSDEGITLEDCEVMTDPIISDTVSYAWGVVRGYGWHKRFFPSRPGSRPKTRIFCPSCWAQLQERRHKKGAGK